MRTYHCHTIEQIIFFPGKISPFTIGNIMASRVTCSWLEKAVTPLKLNLFLFHSRTCGNSESCDSRNIYFDFTSHQLSCFKGALYCSLTKNIFSASFTELNEVPRFNSQNHFEFGFELTGLLEPRQSKSQDRICQKMGTCSLTYRQKDTDLDLI